MGAILDKFRKFLEIDQNSENKMVYNNQTIYILPPHLLFLMLADRYFVLSLVI